MLPSFQRFARPFAVLLLATTASAALAQTQGAPAAARADASVPWLYRGSDIPVDREWVFGELPNGLRYAVRRNGVPPHQVSIRVAIDAGSLNERATEKGYAHFNEHLSFRGSRYVADGEAIRTWQRLGATFGSDTNASTTPTQTIYKLDLPAATPAGLDESVKILSGMMAAPAISATGVDTERRTVLAELREGSGAGQRVGDAGRELFFAGQPLGNHSPIGDIPSLSAATPAGLRGFHDRWYRPDHTLVVIAGDADPATFEALIRKHFSAWRAPAVADGGATDFGIPSASAPRTRVVVEPGLPLSLNIATLRPWRQKNDTIEYNRGKLIDTLALRLISRRLETRARAGGSFLQASVDQDDISRSVDGTFIQIVPLGDDWEGALRDVRGVIADALATPPAQADIDREANEFASALQVSVEQGKTQNGGGLADDLIEAVNIRETVASPEVARDVFANMQDRLTPAALLASTRRMFTGTPLRALLATPKPIADGDARLLAALTADVAPTAARVTGPPVSFSQLPPLGAPATVVKRVKVAEGIEFASLSNDVRVILFANPGEQGRVYVNVRFGRGMQALPTGANTVAWAGGSGLIASGIGPFDQDALDRLTSGRQINVGFGIADDAFQFRGVTRAADLSDELRLIAAKLNTPRWDAAPIVRMRAAMEAGYPAAQASPSGVLGRELPVLLHGGDARWAQPTLADIRALTPEAFRALWEPLLATGPIEVSVFGDIDADKALAAVAGTLGALPPRPPAPVVSLATRGPAPTATPIVLTHSGPADQAAAVLAWPTAGGSTEIYESRKLDILASIYNDRLFDALRHADGAAYSPSVGSNWPAAMPGGGSFTVMSQLNPGRTAEFFTLAKSIAADLVAKPVSADELQRAVGPTRQQIERASSGNTFWLGQLAGSTGDPRRIEAIATLTSDYARITPMELQETAKRWLVPGAAFSLVVLPEKK